ncbi:MAG: NUDIX hydrolase [Bordetella sp.]|nr:MAG: NUDIX hydrolase [Bordetella sp.]
MTNQLLNTYFPAPRQSFFCSQCGSTIHRCIPDGDTRERDVCNNCGAIHYQNPRMVVGTIPILDNRILLCRRAIKPKYNTWTLPAGFMELGESSEECAIRETFEETGIRVKIKNLFTIIDVPKVEQLHLFYLANASNLKFDLGNESLEARFYEECEIPWKELSFHTVIITISQFFKDRRLGIFNMHHYSVNSK